MIKGVTDKCYICGKADHFANDCKKVSIKNEKIPTINVNEKCDCPTSYFSSHRRGKCALNNIISYFEDEHDNIDKLLIHDEANNNSNNHDNDYKDDKQQIKNITCFRCGRIGHYSTSCYASKHIKGYYLK